MKHCPSELQGNVLHRLQRKQSQLSIVIRLALGVRVHAHLSGSSKSNRHADFWQPGDQQTFTLEIDARQTGTQEGCQVDACLQTQAPWQVLSNTLTLDGAAEPSDAYPDTWLPDQPASPCVQVRIRFEGVASTTWQPLASTPVVLPSVRALLTPDRVLINTALPPAPMNISIGNRVPANASAQLNLPAQWRLAEHENGLQLTVPPGLEDGLYELPLSLDGQPAMQVRTIAYPHVSSRVLSTPASLRIRAMNIDASPGACCLRWRWAG